MKIYPSSPSIEGFIHGKTAIYYKVLEDVLVNNADSIALMSRINFNREFLLNYVTESVVITRFIN